MPEKEFTRTLKVKLTSEELHAKGAMLASLLAKQSSLEAEKKATTAQLNADLKTLKAEIETVRDARRDGVEDRPVRCRERYKANTVEVIRTDTKEVIETRVMTPGERQLTIDEVKPPKKPKANPKSNGVNNKPKKPKAKAAPKKTAKKAPKKK